MSHYVPLRKRTLPTTILVFLRNARRVSRNELLLRCVIRRSASQVMRREGFGEHPIDLIDPTRWAPRSVIWSAGWPGKPALGRP